MPTSVSAPTLVGAPERADEKLTYWKQILPATTITAPDAITRQPVTITYDDAYFDDCIDAFKRRTAVDHTMFQLADANNSHGPVHQDYDPERTRGEVVDLRKARPGEKPGLYAKIQFFNRKAARAVRDNPHLGVSARIREGFTRADGVHVKRGIIHVLGTIDGRLNGMGPWRTADLAWYADPSDTQVDLSNNVYPEAPVALGRKNKNRGAGAATDDDGGITSVLENLSDEQFAQLLGELGLTAEDLQDAEDPDEDEDDETDEDEADEDDDDADDEADTERQPVGAGAGASATVDQSIALSAQAAANEALAQLADQAWNTERAALVARGIPPAMVDLAEPVLHHPGGFTVDLSHEDGPEVDIRDIVSKLLDGMAGYVDLAQETGHGGQFDQSQDADPDQPILDAWAAQDPIL